MKSPLVHIPQPCGENVSAMSKCEKGLYCGACKKHLIDLRGKSLPEVNDELKEVSDACIVVDRKNAKQVSWGWAEKSAGFLRKHRFPRIAAMLIAVCLFLASCHHRRRVTTVGYFKNNDKKTELQEEQK